VPGTVRVELAAGGTVCERCLVADTPLLRLRGLIGRPPLEPGVGLLLRPCNSVHTFFMRSAVDVVFCDRELEVLRVVPGLGRGRVCGKVGSKQVFELAPGEAARRGIAPGARLRLVDADA
jgi:uncharacterized membrane protein (UPF0127 family)